MPLFASPHPLLGLATYSSSGQSTGLNIGIYDQGKIYVLLQTLGGSTPRVTPSWQFSPNGTNWLTWRTAATSLRATGLSIFTLPTPFPDLWGRLSYAMAGTGAAIRFRAWAVMKGAQ